MMLGTWLVIVVTILYLLAAIAYLYQQQYGSALIFGSYAIANVGVICLQIGALK